MYEMYQLVIAAYNSRKWLGEKMQPTLKLSCFEIDWVGILSNFFKIR